MRDCFPSSLCGCVLASVCCRRPSCRCPLTHAPRSLCPHAAPDPNDPLRLTDATRSLGLVVLRGTAVMVVCPTDGTEEIANPFVAADA